MNPNNEMQVIGGKHTHTHTHIHIHIQNMQKLPTVRTGKQQAMFLMCGRQGVWVNFLLGKALSKQIKSGVSQKSQHWQTHANI
jgi:hypothetical protein